MKYLFTFLLFFTVSAKAQNRLNVPDARRPNVLFILSDDHAYQAIGAYGNRIVATPGIDRLAREGVLLLNCFVTNSICGPSRATLLTGKYSHKNGYTLNEKRFDLNQVTMPQLLQQNGYQTAWIGKLHLGSLPLGFDYFNILPGQGSYYNPDFIDNRRDTVRYPGYVTNLITEFFFDWMRQRDTSKPFFAVVGEKATHREWLPDLADLGACDNIDFPLPPTFTDDYRGRAAAASQDMTIDKTMRLEEDLKVHLDYRYPEYQRLDSAQHKAFRDYYEGKVSRAYDSLQPQGAALVRWKYQRYLKDYYSTAKSLDRNIARILDYLDSAGLAKNTVVIYASDQGFYLGEHGWFDKRFIYDPSLRTAFLIRYPGVVRPGTTVSDLIANIDWAPTIMDITHTPVPKEMQGKSFLSRLDTAVLRRPFRDGVYYHYYEYPTPHHVSPHFGIRTKDFMLVRFYQGVESWELFDLRTDPDELRNLYGEPGYAVKREALKKQLTGLAREYEDSLALRILARNP